MQRVVFLVMMIQYIGQLRRSRGRPARHWKPEKPYSIQKYQTGTGTKSSREHTYLNTWKEK